jgi:hypothetical protein
LEIRKSFEILLWENGYAGENRNSLYFLTMMTGAVSAAPVLDYTEQSGWKKRSRKGCACPV